MNEIVLSTNQLVLAIVSIIGIIGSLWRWSTRKLHTRVLELEGRNDGQDGRICRIGQQNKLLMQGMVALLQGQIDQGKNGPVKESYDSLQKYLISQTNK